MLYFNLSAYDLLNVNNYNIILSNKFNYKLICYLEIHRKVSARQMDSMDGDEIDKVCMKPIRIDATTANTNDSAAFQIKQFCCNASA